MGVQEKSVQVRWWYWPVLILGSVMIIGGFVYVIVV